MQKVQLGQLLLRGFYWVDNGLQKGLQERGWPEISHAQSMLIIAVGEGINKPTAIATHLGVSRQAVHQTLKDLENLGIVHLLPNPQDKRSKIVELGDLSIPIMLDAKEILMELENKLAKRIGKKNVKVLREALEADWDSN